MNYYISNPYLPTHQIQNTQITPQILHTYYSNILHVIGLPQIFSIHKPINCHETSHKYYLLQSTYYPTWVFTKYAHHITTPKLGCKLHYPHIKPNIIWLVGKTQRKPKFQKSHNDVANSKNPTTMWLIPKSHYDVANSKVRYDAALFTKSTTTRHYLQKPL